MYKIYIVGNDWGEFGKFVAKYDTLQQAERRIEKDALKLVRELHYVRKNFLEENIIVYDVGSWSKYFKVVRE